MKKGIAARVLFGLLMILVIGSQDLCYSFGDKGTITIVNKSNYHILVEIDGDFGDKFLLPPKWTIRERGVEYGKHTVRWYIGFEPHLFLGSQGVDVGEKPDKATVVIEWLQDSSIPSQNDAAVKKPQPESATSTTPSNSTADTVGPLWVLNEVIDDPNKMTGKGSGGYTTWDKISRNSASGGGPDGRWKYTMTASGTPPSELRPGVTFDMVMTVTAAGDKSVGLALGGGIKASGMIIKWEPENQDGTGTAGQGWANDKFWSVPTSSGTAHISVTEASLGTTEVWISPYIGGVGGMAIYKYVKKESSQQAKPSENIKIER